MPKLKVIGESSRTEPIARWSAARLMIYIAFIVSLSAVVAFSNGAGAQSSLTPMQKEYLEKLDGPITLRGDYFKAVQVAYSDFESELAKNASAALSPDTPNRELAEWTSKVENYDVQITKNGGAISVNFISTVRGKFMPVLGGGAHYEINASSFRIESKLSSK